MPFCTNCGHDNPDGANFCAQCGAPLTAAPPQPTTSRPSSGDTTRTIPAVVDEPTGDLSAVDEAAVHALPQGSALLIVQRGPNAGSRFLLDHDETVAGRHVDSDIFLDDISVSRRHVEFRRTVDGVRVKDLGSLNGTYVNRELVDEALLAPEDEVQIGKFRLVYYASAKDADR
ncbi:FHA domain-containing protein [Microlunatus antarcticus]|uniref:PSer/pThr/pTyr-binding forkhead associated (FHA) protein n=1 Tax=Microlunatus antarcticus TaxID=53388 RepID=A0A7W5P7F4_9ACTN|nr:FHA domain-containing protein [Microlunatus antarcticus]MBB3326796.1 pSer/pThr/pTyr-binding forkhead associated (FHA) protein [Microlunatus antarcticus]